MKIIVIFQCFLVLVTGNSLKNNHERELDWWETAVFYQIYPRSFYDSDGDGIGDLKGITLKLEYVKDLGIGAVWLSPIYQSPMYDFGYDISDFYAIHDEYGTMEDFEVLVDKANELGLKVVLDLVPNHASNKSLWFQEALKGNKKYFNYFVWEDGVLDKNGILQPPNNWLGNFRGSAWEYKEEVGKYYFHQFSVSQPDLDFNNPDVIEEIKNVMRFWLNKGAAGFRIDAVNFIFEANKKLHGDKYPDEPVSGIIGVSPEEYNYLKHIYTQNQYDVYKIIYDWRDLLDGEYKAKDGVTRVMMTEAYANVQDVVNYYGDDEREGAHIPFNFGLITDVNGSSFAPDLKRAIDKFMTYKPIDKVANWVVGNHDRHRMATRFGSELVDGIQMLLLLLPGVAITYMGEEIGMLDGYVSWEDTVDELGCNSRDPLNYARDSRDPFRTPFHWDANKNAGFSTANKTWLPVARGYEYLNVEIQKENDRSNLKTYQTLIKLRQEKAFRYGRYDSMALNKNIFVFRRWYRKEIYLVVLNMRDTKHVIDLTYFENMDGIVEVILRSGNSLKNKGDVFSATWLPVTGYEGLVLKHK